MQRHCGGKKSHLQSGLRFLSLQDCVKINSHCREHLALCTFSYSNPEKLTQGSLLIMGLEEEWHCRTQRHLESKIVATIHTQCAHTQLVDNSALPTLIMHAHACTHTCGMFVHCVKVYWFDLCNKNECPIVRQEVQARFPRKERKKNLGTRFTRRHREKIRGARRKKGHATW